MSILTQKFTTQHDTAPFSQIKNEDFLPAFKDAIATAKQEIDEIIANPEAPTFENTIEAMDILQIYRLFRQFISWRDSKTD